MTYKELKELLNSINEENIDLDKEVTLDVKNPGNGYGFVEIEMSILNDMIVADDIGLVGEELMVIDNDYKVINEDDEELY